MRNISQFAVSMVLLASQVHTPLTGGTTASAASSDNAAVVYEVKLNTNIATAVELVGKKQLDYDADVLNPLHAAQSVAAAKAAAAISAAKLKAKKASVQLAAPVIAIAGSHADWMRSAGISESDFGYVDYIIDHESGWGVTKSNYGGSGAYGLGQALPASKMAKFGSDYLSDPVTQLRWANAYAVGCYGSWANAYNHWVGRHSW
jgi:hypothetical protein